MKNKTLLVMYYLVFEEEGRGEIKIK